MSVASQPKPSSTTKSVFRSGRSHAEPVLRRSQTAPTRTLLEPATFCRTHFALAFSSHFILEAKPTRTLASPTRGRDWFYCSPNCGAILLYTCGAVSDDGSGCLMAEFGFAAELPAHERLPAVPGLVPRQKTVSALTDALRGLVLGSVRHCPHLSQRRHGCWCRYQRKYARC